MKCHNSIGFPKENIRVSVTLKANITVKCCGSTRLIHPSRPGRTFSQVICKNCLKGMGSSDRRVYTDATGYYFRSSAHTINQSINHLMIYIRNYLVDNLEGG